MKRPEKNQIDFNTEFDPVTHIGKVNGVIWPSVTQLLQEFGLIDYSMVPKERLEAKRLIGIRVHAATNMIDNGNLDEKHFNKKFPDCLGYLEAYRKFRVIENFVPVHKQNRYFSMKWKFHGEPDEQGIHIQKTGKKYVIVDYKCTWKMFASTGTQLAAYAILIQEALGIEIEERYGLLLKPNGNYTLHEFKEMSDGSDFLYCAILHWKKRTKYGTLNEQKLIKMYTE